MFAKSFLPTFDISFVSVDSIFRISAQQLTDALIVPTFFKDVERNSAFSGIDWLFDVLLLKQELQIVNTKSENALVGKLWSTFEIIEQWCLCTTPLKHYSKIKN